MEVLTAPTGFCMGIERAYRGISKRAQHEPPFTVTHQNARNPNDTLLRIEKREPELMRRYPGLDRLNVARDADAIEPGTRVVLGFHGLEPDDKRRLATNGIDLLDDLVCPFIAKLDRVVERHVAAGYDVAMVGSPDNHHLRTARKVAVAHDRRCFAIVEVQDIEALPISDGRPIVLVGEVTGNTQVYHEVIARIEEKGLPIKIKRTMCADSYARQSSASELAGQADVVLVVDDGGDGARSVYEVCTRVNHRVHRIRDRQEIDRAWVADATKVAVVGGILIPDWTIAEVARHVREMVA